MEKPAARRSEWLQHSGVGAHVSKQAGGSKRPKLTFPCDAARVGLDELLHEKADDQLGLGGEGQFFLARWRRKLQGTRKSATSLGGWRKGGARAHAHLPLHQLGSVLALLLLVHHGARRSNVQDGPAAVLAVW